MSDLLSQIHQITKCGQQITQENIADLEILIGRVEEYMSAFEKLQGVLEGDKGLSSLDEQQAATLKPALEELNNVHQKVTDWAVGQRDEVAGSLTDLQKRSQAVKAYLNRYPARVSVTGKRQG